MNKELENNEKFIHQVVGKDTGFSVPQNYFEEIEDSFSTYLFEEKNSKKTTFEIPNNYFNTLEDNILDKVLVNKKPIKVISLKQRILKRVPLIAAAVVILFIGLNSFNFGEQALPTFDAITDIRQVLKSLKFCDINACSTETSIPLNILWISFKSLI